MRTQVPEGQTIECSRCHTRWVARFPWEQFGDPPTILLFTAAEVTAWCEKIGPVRAREVCPCLGCKQAYTVEWWDPWTYR